MIRWLAAILLVLLCSAGCAEIGRTGVAINGQTVAMLPAEANVPSTDLRPGWKQTFIEIDLAIIAKVNETAKCGTPEGDSFLACTRRFVAQKSCLTIMPKHEQLDASLYKRIHEHEQRACNHDYDVETRPDGVRFLRWKDMK